MKLLNQPFKIFIICLVVSIGSLLLNGTFFQLYRLDRDTEFLTMQMIDTRAQITEIEKQIKLTKDPAFFEKQALDNLDFATEDDLIFVFSDDEDKS